MPDLKTALSAILPEWETDQQRIEQEKDMKQKPATRAYHFQTTNNVTRLTYDYIAQHPGSTQPAVVNALVAQGYKEGSVASLCSQFVRQGLVSRDDATRKLTAIKPFQPLKSSKAQRAKTPPLRPKKEVKPIVNVMKRKYTKKDEPTAQGIAALPPQGGEEKRGVTSLIINRGWTAQGVVDKLTVVQARQLYDLLRDIFGGK